MQRGVVRGRGWRCATWTAAVAVVAGGLIAAASPAGATASPQRLKAVQVSAGSDHACALVEDGSIFCWGDNHHGALGRGVAGEPDVGLAPGRVPVDGTDLEGEVVVEVSAGLSFTCARTASSKVVCWGFGLHGQMGDGGSTDQLVPTAVPTVGTPLQGKQVTAIATGSFHACATTSQGDAACWGLNRFGRQGAGDTDEYHRTPTAVTKASGAFVGRAISTLSIGDTQACGLATDGTTACWGQASSGSLGGGPSSVTTGVPTAIDRTGTVLEGKTVTQAVTQSRVGCALSADDVLACWGSNAYGQLGNPTLSSANRAAPVLRTGTPLAGRTIDQLASGLNNACALTTTDEIACWGYGGWYALGQGASTADAASPVLVDPAGTGLAGEPVASIELGSTFACALTEAGEVWCWGRNDERQLGNDAVVLGRPGLVQLPFRPVDPTPPGPPTDVVAVAGNASATVSWAAPSSPGSAPITGYRITPYVGGSPLASVDAAGTATSTVVTGLANGTAHAFRVAAINAVGAGSLSTASNTVTPSAPWAPFASWAALVDRLHLDLTGAAPSAAARQAWVASLTEGTLTPGALADQIRRGTDGTAKVDPTVRLYRALLGRAPDPGGLRFWVDRRRAGTWTLNRMAEHFAASNEFKATYGPLTNRQFVTRLYTDVLARPADASGVDYWTKKLDTKQRTRGSVVVGFSESGEYQRKQRERTDVSVAWIYLLGRTPPAADADAWVARQLAGVPHADLLGEVLASDAYATRATS